LTALCRILEQSTCQNRFGCGQMVERSGQF
jgi:hypothetical protein